MIGALLLQPLLLHHPAPCSEAISPLPPTMPDFSIFDNAHETTPSGSLSQEAFMKGIREGVWDADVRGCRSILQQRGIKAYKDSRESVPCVTISTSLKHRRGGTSLKQKGAIHTGRLQVDIDPGHNPGMILTEARRIVESAPFISDCFLSLSGEGIKAIARIPPSFETHLGSWFAVAQYFKARGLVVDPATKDACRMCFVSADPNAFSRADPIEIEPVELPEVGEEPSRSPSKGTVRHEWAREVLTEIAKNLGGRPSYPDWIKVSSATFEGVGVETGIEMLEEIWPEEKRGEYKSLAKSLATHIPWGTLRAYGVNPDDPEDLLAGLPDLEATSQADDDGFPIVHANDLEGVAEGLDFVEGILTEGGASVVYGPPNCGKTFAALELGTCVATGRPFRGTLAVEQGAVIYVALEGTLGARNRIEALKRSGKLPKDAPLYLCFAPVTLLDCKHPAKLIASIKRAAKESGFPCRLVILDTLARAIAGGDENSGKDMGKAVRAIDAIRHATGAHVMLIHHCGKNEALGARGHSSLRGAVDTEIEIIRPEGESISTIRITKQRDLPYGNPMPFSLEVIHLGTDRRGKSITSCVIRHEDEAMASKPGKPGRKAKCTADEMFRFLPAASITAWKERVHEECGLGGTQFYENKKKLEAEGKFRREEGTNRIVRTDLTDMMPDLGDAA